MKPVAVGHVTADLRLVEADRMLDDLHRACGGEAGGELAVPELRILAKKAMANGVKLARSFEAVDTDYRITGFVELVPTIVDQAAVTVDGCDLSIMSLNREPRPFAGEVPNEDKRAMVDMLTECTLRLDPQMRVIDAETEAVDLETFADALKKGEHWADQVQFENGVDPASSWQLMDEAQFRVEGSNRAWVAHFLPLGAPEPGSAGFIVQFTSPAAPPPPAGELPNDLPALGRDLSPVLRQPINRIIANAETIRTRLAGPLPDEYANYAADIATAGQHLLSLIDDMADLEIVESDDFTTAPDRIELGDVARQACGILGVRARERGIRLVPPPEGENQPAIAEFRRVLQVLLNLVNNAIRYTPEGSQVWVRLDRIGQRAMITVADQGHGIEPDQQDKVFAKFERLGRSGDGGSGLGLYISRRIARAMDGDLTVESAPGQGARFTLSVPAAIDDATGPAG